MSSRTYGVWALVKSVTGKQKLESQNFIFILKKITVFELMVQYYTSELDLPVKILPVSSNCSPECGVPLVMFVVIHE